MAGHLHPGQPKALRQQRWLGWHRRVTNTWPWPSSAGSSHPAERRAARRSRQARPQSAGPTAASTEDASHVAPGPLPSSLSHLLSACASASELTTVLEERLDQGADDESLVMAALQLASRLRRDPHFLRSPDDLGRLLPVLERALRRNLVAFTPIQLGLATRCYVLLGGGSPLVLSALQDQACSWAAEEYSAGPISELTWSLVWAKHPPTPAMAAHLAAAVQQEQRDWGAWLGGARAGRLVMLLWGLASLRCKPCAALLEAACQRLQQVPLSGMPTKSLLTLLWALAKLQPPNPQGAAEALSQELCTRLELQLLEEQHPGAAQRQAAAAAATAAAAAAAATAAAAAAAATAAAAAAGVSDSGSDGGDTRNEEEEAEEQVAGGCEEVAAVGSSLTVPMAVGRWDDELVTSQLASLVWAWGRLSYRSSQGLRMATLLLGEAVGELSAADMTRMLWGLAQLEYSPSQLLGQVCERLKEPGELRALSTAQLAVVMYAFSATDYFPGDALLDAIADLCMEEREHMDPRSLCHVLWALARMGYVDEPFYLGFVPVVLADMERYGPGELVDLCRVYAKLGLAPEGLFEAVAERTVAVIEDVDIQDLLRILTAFNELGLQPAELLAAVEQWANQRLTQLSPQALTLALSTFARLGGPRPPALLSAATECVMGQLDRFETQHLALVVWSFAKLEHHPPAVLDHAVGLLQSSTSRFGDKAVSNVLWALATLQHPLPQPGQTLDTIAANLEGRLKTFGAQSLSNIAWAYATLGHNPSPKFLRELGDAAKDQLPAFESQGLALLVWALATMGYRHEPLLSSIDAYCSSGSRLRGFEGQHLSNLLWGMAKVGHCPSGTFCKQFAKEAGLLVADLRPQEIFNICWAFATLRQHPGNLLDSLAAEAACRPFALSSQELSGLLWALARLRHARGAGARALLRASEREVQTRGSEFEDRHLALAVWAWSELGHSPEAESLGAVCLEMEGRVATLGSHSLTTLLKGLAAVGYSPQPQLVSALTARALAIAHRMKPFECCELLDSLLALGLEAEALELLNYLAATPCRDSSGRGGGSLAGAEQEQQRAQSSQQQQQQQQQQEERRRSLLEAAAAAAPLTAVIRLLGAMVELGAYPEPAFAQVCRRLKSASPTYLLSHRYLHQLGGALERAESSHRERIRLHPELLRKATAAAASAQPERGARMVGRGEGQAGGSGDRGEGQAPSRQVPAGVAAAGEQDGATDDVEGEDGAYSRRSNAWFSGQT